MIEKSTADPLDVYEAKHSQFQTQSAEMEEKSSRFSNARALVFVLTLVLMWFGLIKSSIAAQWLLLPMMLFAVLVWMHARLKKRLHRIQRAQEFYACRMEHLAGNWGNDLHTGMSYVDASHPYTSDLDVFGAGSLFEFLCCTKTRLGKDTLASWLKTSADADSITMRQDAVRELSHCLEFREELALIDAVSEQELSEQQFKSWVDEASLLIAWQRNVAVVLGVLALLSLVVWGLGYGYWPILMVIALEIPLYISCYKHVAKMASRAEKVSSTLETLKPVLALIENNKFESKLLIKLTDDLRVDASIPSVEMTDLYNILGNLNQAVKNQLLIPLALFFCVPVHLAFKLDLWRKQKGANIAYWLNAAGQIEALVSLAQFGFENPAYTYPELSSATKVPMFNAVALSHPLIRATERVSNDIHLNADQRLVIVSGSNMSGKSTLLRSIGVGVVLASCGAPVPAERMQLSRFSIGCAMRANDSLQQGASFFYAVISRIKCVVDLARNEPPVLFLLDEILQGTNSRDRLIGAKGVIHQLLAFNAVGLVTTHDLALTHIADSLDGSAINIHFEDQFVNNKISFDYKIRPGVIQKSNGLELMRMIGLDVGPVEE